MRTDRWRPIAPLAQLDTRLNIFWIEALLPARVTAIFNRFGRMDLSTVEHVAHVCDVRRVPLADVSVEALGIVKHAAHVRNI